MSKTVSLNVPLTEKLKEFIHSQSGSDTLYSTPSEYVRDLIRHDFEKKQQNKLDFSMVSNLLRKNGEKNSEYFDDMTIPRSQQEKVLKRIEKSRQNPERLLNWEDVKDSISFE